MNMKRVFTGTGVGFLALVAFSAVAFVNAPGTIVSSAATAVEGTSADNGGQDGEFSGPAEEPHLPANLQTGSSQYNAFQATAYCDFGITFSGILVHRGMVAADPNILPIGSVIEVKAGEYSGIYTVMDTGGVVKGHLIDIYMPDYEEAVQFGRQGVKVRVLRLGWHPDDAPDLQYTFAG